jgi:hypothetical protein
MIVLDNHSHFSTSSQPLDTPSPVLDLDSGFRSHRQSLVDQWGPQDTVNHCPKSQHHWVNLATGVVGGPVTCRRVTCIFCLRIRAKHIKAAVAFARPSHLATITSLSGDWQSDRNAVNRMRFYLRDRDHLTFAFAWAVEPNPRGTGYHAHGWVWGDPMPRDRFQYRAAQVGFGITQMIRVTHGGNFGYTMKNAMHNAQSLDEHIRLNGREPIHARGFWRDARTGELLTQPEAFRRSDSGRPHGPDIDQDDWVVVSDRSIETGSI